MGNLEKPEGQLYVDLLIRIYRDSIASDDYEVTASLNSMIDRDYSTISIRVAKEGISFLTKVLPSVGKALDSAMSSDTPFRYVGPLATRNGYPKLFNLLWTRIFDAEGYVRVDSNSLRDEDQRQAVRTIRQVCFLFYKLKGSHSPESEQQMLDKFLLTDQELPLCDSTVKLSKQATLALENARMLIWWALKDFNPEKITPKHGPGAVATGEKNWEKFNFSRFYSKLDKMFPYSDHFYFNYGHLCDEYHELELLEAHDFPTAKIALVEKDSRGPRLISMEPLEIQWIQQGMMRDLYKVLEAPHNICSGYVNFTNQEINRTLALDNSMNSTIATVDMKEASDRVSHWLVKQLFPKHLLPYFEACRSEETQLPCGRRVHLNKFAPMGSAVCFPIEALVFWALAVGSLTTPILKKSQLAKLPKVYVYGDDLILGKSEYSVIAPIFNECFLTFNEDKCCTGRFFRESCGMDAFKFLDVTPIRCKTPWSEKLSPTASVAFVELTNSLQQRGFVESAKFLRGRLIQILGNLPVTNRRDAIALVFYRNWTDNEVWKYSLKTYKSRFNNDLQRYEVRLPVLSPALLVQDCSEWGEMWRCSKQGPPSPLGEAPRITPRRYEIPGRLDRGWKWVDVTTLLTCSNHKLAYGAPDYLGKRRATLI